MKNEPVNQNETVMHLDREWIGNRNVKYYTASQTEVDNFTHPPYSEIPNKRYWRTYRSKNKMNRTSCE